jgi:hypothetical protein
VRHLLMNLMKLHSEHTKGSRFNIVTTGDDERVEAWKQASNKPEDLLGYIGHFKGLYMAAIQCSEGSSKAV